MMSQDLGIEDLVLSGKIFSSSHPPRSPSRSRSPSPDPLWPSNGNTTDSDLSISPSERQHNSSNGGEWPSAPYLGRAGVKGMLQEHREAVNQAKIMREKQVAETNRRMEKMALNARTYAEEEEEREQKKRQLEGLGAQTSSKERPKRLFQRTGHFGQLREIGLDGFEGAVEDELSETWVLVHIYDPSLSRCHDLDAVLARLARKYPQTKFLRACASVVQFFSSEYMSHANPKPQSNLISTSEKEFYQDDDSYLHGDEEEDHTDVTVLPTLLAYRAGHLEHAWIRVDMEVETLLRSRYKGVNVNGVEGVEALLQCHNVIQPFGNGNCGFSSDEDDLELQVTPDRKDDVDDEDLFDL